MKFKAHAKLAGFEKALKVEPEEDLPNNQEEAEALTGMETDTVRKKKAVDRNYKVVASFTLAFETEGLLNLVLEAQSEE